MPSAVLLLRHAQSEWNALGLWQGHADPPLSEEGRRQAAAAADRIRAASWFAGFDLVVCSDLSRARETADLLAAGLELAVAPQIDEGLREFDAGEWSGHTLAEIEQAWPGDVERFSRGALESPPGGEKRGDFDMRVAEATNRVASLAAANEARSVLIVTHGGVVGSIARSAGLARRHTSHLAGYRGDLDAGALFPRHPIDLLDISELVVDRS